MTLSSESTRANSCYGRIHSFSDQDLSYRPDQTFILQIKTPVHKKGQGLSCESLGNLVAELDQGARPPDLSSGLFPLKQELANYDHWPYHELRMVFTLLNG